MKRIFPYFILVLIIFLAYANTWMNSFHFDDITSILKKPWVRGLDKIPDFIFSFGQRPLVILFHNINYWMSEYRVWSYHLFNTLLHAAATLLVYRLTSQARSFLVNGGTGWTSLPFIAALVFGLHPLSTQSVTYISSRSSLLATIFYLATMTLFFKGLQTPMPVEGGKRRYGLGYFLGAGLCLGLGAMSKEIVVTLPAMLFLFHYYFVSRATFLQWLRDQGKWIGTLVAVLGTAILFKISWSGGLLPNSSAQISPADYLLTQTSVIPFEYFAKMLFPFNLNVDIDYPILSGWAHPANWKGIVALLLYLAILIAVSASRGHGQPHENYSRKLVGFGMAWAAITLLPTSSAVPLLDVAVEHRTYLPLVGFSIAFAALVCGLFQRFRLPETGMAFPFAICLAATMSVFILFAAAAMDRNRVWKDEVTLWADAKKKSPYLIRPYNNLGEAYDKRKEYAKAIPEFEAAVRLNPNYFFALSNLGNIYGKIKQYPKAIEYLRKALQVNPEYAPANYNLAKALHLVGKPEEAIEHYRQATQHDPYFEEAFYNLAALALQLGRNEESMENFQRFLKMQPRHHGAHFQLAHAYAGLGRLDDAIKEFQKTVEIKPDYIFGYVGIANIMLQTGKIDNAIRVYEVALILQPGMVGIHKNLGMLYRQKKTHPEKAAHHFQEYLHLQPNAPDAEAVQSIIDQLTPIRHGGQ